MSRYSKGPGVFPSFCAKRASLLVLQFRRVHGGDSESRYAIRAGRNLPDKEFRYLRMVIVTTAVYWGLSSRLRSEELTSPLDLPAPGRRQSVYIVLQLRTDLCFW